MALQVLICDVLMVLFQVVLSLELPIFDLIDVVLTVIALALGFWQCIKQSRENRKQQREQNEKNWYVSVIVLPQLDSINKMFETLVDKTNDSYQELKKNPDLLIKASRQNECKEIISSSLSHVQQMVASYDRNLSGSISVLIDDLQDCVTNIIESSDKLSKSDIRTSILNYNAKLISILFERNMQ